MSMVFVERDGVKRMCQWTDTDTLCGFCGGVVLCVFDVCRRCGATVVKVKTKETH